MIAPPVGARLGGAGRSRSVLPRASDWTKTQACKKRPQGPTGVRPTVYFGIMFKSSLDKKFAETVKILVYHKNRSFDKIWFLTWFGLVLRSDSESA